MHENVARVLYHLQIHLLYASIVCLAAWALTSIRRGSPTAKYWIWVATAFNFMVPLAAVVDVLGSSHLRWARPLGIFGEMGVTLSETAPAATIGLVWLVGVTAMSTRLWLRLRADRLVARNAPFPSGRNPNLARVTQGVPVRFTGKGRGPAVAGVLRPRIMLPDGIDRLLDPEELEAVLLHELTHARRRDNLLHLIYELGRCVLWFHPLVWLVGARLALYRELSCDESATQKARGGQLVSALRKLAISEEPFLLQASASSHLSHRVAQLTAGTPRNRHRAAGALLIAAYTVVFLGGLFETIAHTACCFAGRG